MNIRYFRHAVIAAAALAGLPTLADTMHPGALCTSEGPVAKSLTGLIVNKRITSTDDSTYFHCPIVRSPGLWGGNVTATVTVRTNPSSAAFNCRMRSVYGNNDTWSEDEVSFANNIPYDTKTLSVAVPLVAAVVNMRCSVPNAPSSGSEAGIVSYFVNE